MPKELPHGRQATETDCFLVTPADGSISEDNPVLPLTSAQEESVRAMIRRPSWYGNDDELRRKHAGFSRLIALKPLCSSLTRSATPLTCLGRPLFWTISPYESNTPDWNCLAAGIEKLKKHQIPDIKNSHHHEITLGDRRPPGE
jgi:hypothetical protein